MGDYEDKAMAGVARECELDAATSSLAASIDGAAFVLADLEQRLAPVLSQREVPVGADPKDRRGFSAPLAVHVAAMADRVEELARRLHDLHARVEV